MDSQSSLLAQQCVYCMESAPHPRLGRGEQYKCGYKPYRCDICDYSTTTKGNLSIHMQSDKHINNLKELKENNNSAVNTPSKSVDLNGSSSTSPTSSIIAQPTSSSTLSTSLSKTKHLNESEHLDESSNRLLLRNKLPHLAGNSVKTHGKGRNGVFVFRLRQKLVE